MAGKTDSSEVRFVEELCHETIVKDFTQELKKEKSFIFSLKCLCSDILYII